MTIMNWRAGLAVLAPNGVPEKEALTPEPGPLTLMAGGEMLEQLRLVRGIFNSETGCILGTGNLTLSGNIHHILGATSTTVPDTELPTQNYILHRDPPWPPHPHAMLPLEPLAFHGASIGTMAHPKPSLGASCRFHLSSALYSGSRRQPTLLSL